MNIGPYPGEQCPSCGAHMAADQRYCLTCGSRRGDPRLPFMDAVVFMDAIRRPAGTAAAPLPRERQPRMSANASLIAGVATLVLAIGVGVLIGRSGEESAPTAASPPQVITVGGGEVEATGTEQPGSGGGAKKSSKDASSGVQEGASGTSKAAEEVLKPEGDVKLPPPKTQVGDTCEKGTAGCSESGEFDGSFFGE